MKVLKKPEANESAGITDLFRITGSTIRHFNNGVVCTIIVTGFNSGPKKFTGKSRCHPDDVFDSTKGEDIAEHRAMAKMYKHIFNECIVRAKYARDLAEDWLEISSKASMKQLRQQNALLKMIYNENSD